MNKEDGDPFLVTVPAEVSISPFYTVDVSWHLFYAEGLTISSNTTQRSSTARTSRRGYSSIKILGHHLHKTKR